MQARLVLGLELQAYPPPYLGKKMLFPDQSFQCCAETPISNAWGGLAYTWDLTDE